MRELVDELLTAQVLSPDDWARAPVEFREAVARQSDIPLALRTLVERELLTAYQAARIESGGSSGLVLGPYRVLDRLGIGDQGVVLLGEHVRLRTSVVLKILGQDEDADWSHLPALARVRHPGLLHPIDAGAANDSAEGTIRYVVREQVTGVDLETHIHGRGLLSGLQTCDILQQLALALTELHARGLIHGRVKPANVLIAADNRALLMDADASQSRVSGHPRRVAFDWLAPEQLVPGRPIDERTDLYGLGCVLFWCLVGESLYGNCRTAAEALALRKQPPPAVSQIDPGLPPALDLLLAELLAVDPDQRPGSAREVADFLATLFGTPPTGPRGDLQPRPQVLLAGTRAETLALCGAVLSLEDVMCEETCEWEQALRALESRAFDLVLLASRMREATGPEMCRRVRASGLAAEVPLLVLLEPDSPDEVEGLLRAGADDVALLPQSVLQLQRRVGVLLRLKSARDRAAKFHHALLQAQHGMPTDETLAGLDALVLLVSRVAQERQGAATWRGPRLQRYVRLFAEEAARASNPPLPPAYIDLLVRVVPLVDLGLLVVPDEVLLTDDPALQRHDVIARCQTVDAARLLRSVGHQHRAAWGLIQMGVEVVRHHQERYDGRGHPDRLQGGNIPLAARLVAPCLAYDNLHSPRPYRPAMTHRAALEMLQQTWTGAFDPALRAAFFRAAASFTQ